MYENKAISNLKHLKYFQRRKQDSNPLINNNNKKKKNRNKNK